MPGPARRLVIESVGEVPHRGSQQTEGVHDPDARRVHRGGGFLVRQHVQALAWPEERCVCVARVDLGCHRDNFDQACPWWRYGM